MNQDKEYAEYAVLQATAHVLNCQIDVIDLTQGANAIQLNLHETIARVERPEQVICLIRVNNNHYHATGANLMLEQQRADPSSSHFRQGIGQTLLGHPCSARKEGSGQKETFSEDLSQS